MDVKNLLTDTVITDLIAVGATIAGAVVIHQIVFGLMAGYARRTGGAAIGAVRRRFYKPGLLILPLIGILAMLPSLEIAPGTAEAVRNFAALASVLAFGWGVVAAINVGADVISERYSTDRPDNLDARRIQTQTQMLRRVGIVVTVIVTGTVLLMSIPSLRHLGISLFASAGVAGLVVGLAARPTLSNLIAGIQMALTQPIRIDDVVIVEGEWGRIEEIRTTYVVVRIWDLRRLVVPLSYFIENPFQNWTRTTADLLGSVFLEVDYTVPVEELRQELRRIVEASGMWDGKVCVLQVTDAKERTVVVRALMSAPDSSKAWDIRCHVREKLIAYMQAHHPGSLPRFRAELRTEPLAA